RVRTITARTTRFPCFSTKGESGAASLTEAVITSPSRAYCPADPPRIRIHAILRAPELSATSRMVPIWIIAASGRSAEGGLSPLPVSGSRCSSGLRPHEDLPQPPPLQLRKRPGLLDADAVAHAGLVALVVSVEPARPLDRPGVLRVLDAALDLHDDRLVHPIGDDA